MTEHCDDLPDDEWPNDDEANDIMLAYAATDDSQGSGSGCAGVILILMTIALELVWTIVR